jgi:hypothetical protein
MIKKGSPDVKKNWQECVPSSLFILEKFDDVFMAVFGSKVHWSPPVSIARFEVNTALQSPMRAK